MSENENTGAAGPAGSAGPHWGWEPVPHGGEFDSDATAFVKLPQDMLDALGTGEPLAAPGHGYVPPPMIVPLGTASTDPSATGTWSMPVQWPEAGSAAPVDAGAGSAGTGSAGAAVRAPIPASVPIPAAVAAAFADPAAEQVAEPAADAFGEPFGDSYAEPYAEPFAGSRGSGHEPGATAEWQFPEAAASDVWTPGGAGDTGSFGQLAAAADWSQAPATLPGGAAAPWATHPDFEGARGYVAQQPGGDGAGSDPLGSDALGPDPLGSGVLPGASAPAGATFGSALGRGPRVLGGPGVGTPLDGEPGYPAPHDIEAAHGPAQLPDSGERQHPGTEGEVRGEDGAGVEGEAGAAVVEAEQGVGAGAPGSGGAGDRGASGEQDAAGAGAGEAEPGDGGAVPADGGAGAAPAPGTEDADLAVGTARAETAEGIPGEGETYEEGAADGADATAVAQHEHPSASYVLRVNGADRPVTGAWIGESLLYVLRERLGLAGAKDGCSQGECGACAVQVDGRLVASCLVPAATAAGSEVRTVEGLATDGELSDVQEALCRSGAVQCGFCVPGMAMTIHDLLEGNHAPSELETRRALCGNLCRCSGYSGVIEAVREVVAERGSAAEAAAAASAEARIPHQAAPGEGGFHGMQGNQGTYGQGNHGHQGNHEGGTA
ncbi:2Fe-2S iron-sulfur cluster-binding protein [Streptomyces sp. TBY4]|uniref:2Fe-2S iron-sulfur cluster-binding protein n=1 Tax=Streptomyces sp. TBY4 TaxID=2962030 RepID=UPI0020B65698|nr:2Fe-2S iron-sulfur cluster-binding protein [Streptomyces sp. TBY4]MCP3756309.1 2Fe-2S iron-sulfur cluster-binding protein [Streptomyces sp. TBY4]